MDEKKKRDMSVEDILLEHEMKKKQASQEAPAVAPAAPPSAVEKFEHPRAARPQRPRSAVEVFGVKPQEDGDEDVKVASPAGTEESPAAAVQKKKEEDTRRIPVFRPAPEEATPKTVAVSMRTRVLSVAPPEPDPLHDTQELDGQLEGQLVLENFYEEEMDEEQVEEELLRRRREKVSGFRIIEGGKTPEPEERPRFKLTGEEEESDTDEVIPEEDTSAEDLLEDFNEYAEADAIRSELAYRRRMGGLAVIASAVLEILLIVLTVLYDSGSFTMLSPSVLVALHTAMLIGLLCVNHRLVISGLKGLFRLRADADTPPALCGVLGLVYTVTQFAQTAAVSDGQAYFLSAAAGMALLAGALGRQVQNRRIQRNFGFVGNEKQKKNAATLLEDQKVADVLGYPEGEDGMPRVVYFRRVSFLTRFLDMSYASDPADRVMRWFAPLVLGVSALCAVGYGLLFPDGWARAWLLFVTSVMLCMPCWSMFAVQRAVSRSCRKALRKGTMIGGFEAAQSFGKHPKTVIFEAAELFPKDRVKLHGIKTFSGTRIDEAITDAAAVMIAAKGPLCPIFHRLIENRTDILREVDSLAYEQDMGLSGWVGGRRVLIGNRRLLENHGVDVPPKDYEDRYVRDDRSVVYLSTGGELSAMFVVSYLANEAIKKQLRALEREHARITVRTCDPNITEALMCEVMELPVRSVEVLSAGEGRVYEGLLHDTQTERTEAVLACGGHAVSKAFGVVQCCRMRRGVWASLISQMVLSILAMLFCLFITATTGVVLKAVLLPVAVVAYGAVAWLVGRIFRS